MEMGATQYVIQSQDGGAHTEILGIMMIVGNTLLLSLIITSLKITQSSGF